MTGVAYVTAPVFTDTLRGKHRYAPTRDIADFSWAGKAAPMNTLTAQATAARYSTPKAHPCGCITVWDNQGGGPRYQHACSTHTRGQHRWPANGR